MSAPRLILAFALGGALVQAACGSGGDRDGTAASVSEASATSDGAIRSSIHDGAELTDPIRWRVRVRGVSTSDVTAVQFLIDGELADVDRQEPYRFEEPGFRAQRVALATGSHTFAVTARLADGARLTTASTATVSRRAGR